MPFGSPQSAKIKIARFLGVPVGEAAPEFAATTIAGRPLKSQDLQGKVVLLDFWATWCAPCVAEIPNIKRLREKFSANGRFEVVGFSLDDHEASVAEFVRQQGLSWPQIMLGPDESNSIRMLYNVGSIPATFLIDADGRVVANDLRGSALEAKVSELLSQSPKRPKAGNRGR